MIQTDSPIFSVNSHTLGYSYFGSLYSSNYWSLFKSTMTNNTIIIPTFYRIIDSGSLDKVFKSSLLSTSWLLLCRVFCGQILGITKSAPQSFLLCDHIGFYETI